MAEYIELKSKAVSVYDFRNVDITSFVPEFTPDQALLDKDLNRFLSRYGTKQECEEAQEGDLAVLSCKSKEPKFCKENITVPLGKGMFSKELETQLYGVKKDQEITCQVNGTEVAVRIGKITRTLLSELTDETVKSWGMEGVDSVAALRRQCINRQIDRFLDEDESADNASAYVWQEVGKNSVIELDPEEERHAREDSEKKIQEMVHPTEADPGETDLVEETDAAEEAFEYDPAEMEKMIREIFVNELRMAAVGNKMRKDAGTLLTMEDYESYLKKWMDYYDTLTEEEIREKYSMEEFMRSSYCEVIALAIDNYVAECFKNVMNP